PMQNLARRTDQSLTSRGELEATTRAREQLSVDITLKRAQGLRDRGLGDEELIRGRVNPTLIDDGEEVLQLPHIHPHTLSIRSESGTDTADNKGLTRQPPTLPTPFDRRFLSIRSKFCLGHH